MKFVILLSIVIFACITISIKREKLPCIKYVRKINDVKATPQPSTTTPQPSTLIKHIGRKSTVLAGVQFIGNIKFVSNITMLVVNDINHKEKYKVNSKSLEKYAKTNHYSFIEKIPNREHRCNHVKNFFFKKHCVVYYYMVDSKKNCEWIFVFDGDNAIRNPNTNIKLESFVKPKKDILYYYRFHNNEIAAGNYAIKNTQWSLDYLKGYYELHNTYKGFNFDNGGLHYYLLPDKNKCDTATTLDMYFKYVGCVQKELQAANFPLKPHIYVYPHGKAWTYDGWVVSYKWSKDTLMHHAMKRPPRKGDSYENTYTDEKELNILLDETLKKQKKKLPFNGWEYTRNAWNVRKNIQDVFLDPMMYNHLDLFNKSLRKQLN